MWFVYHYYVECGWCIIIHNLVGVSLIRMWLVYHFYVNHAPPEHHLKKQGASGRCLLATLAKRLAHT